MQRPVLPANCRSRCPPRCASGEDKPRTPPAATVQAAAHEPLRKFLDRDGGRDHQEPPSDTFPSGPKQKRTGFPARSQSRRSITGVDASPMPGEAPARDREREETRYTAGEPTARRAAREPSRLLMTSAGLGLPRRKPWAISQPISSRVSSWVSSSTPSAITVSDRACPTPRIACEQLAALDSAVVQRRHEAAVDLEDVVPACAAAARAMRSRCRSRRSRCARRASLISCRRSQPRCSRRA